jgi:hypothetical protein
MMFQNPSEAPAIVWFDGKLSNQHWVLEKEEMTLGREDVCDIVIPMRQVSRQHLVFRRVDGACIVEDLDSKNGTWVNGYRLTGARELEDGDEIRLAKEIRLRFVGSGVTAPTMTRQLPEVIPSAALTGLRLRLDPESRQVFIHDQELVPPLSLPQYRLLELLFMNQGSVCTRDEVVEAVWPDVMGDGVSEQAIDALVRRLRDRLTELDADYQYVVTVRGHGFRLDNPSA